MIYSKIKDGGETFTTVNVRKKTLDKKVRKKTILKALLTVGYKIKQISGSVQGIEFNFSIADALLFVEVEKRAEQNKQKLLTRH